ncbi:MAG: XisI protein [Calothrix sp. MO_167.B12]|nr:XisI protein [Calothrix sp. MO_167.B12]
MDKLERYRYIIKKILSEYEKLASQTPNPPGVDSILSFDDKNDQYIWLVIGWQEGRRVKGMTVYVRIKNEKIYIEEDWTEEGIATDLLRKGVPNNDIVLAFHSPEKRQYTEFATA